MLWIKSLTIPEPAKTCLNIHRSYLKLPSPACSWTHQLVGYCCHWSALLSQKREMVYVILLLAGPIQSSWGKRIAWGIAVLETKWAHEKPWLVHPLFRTALKNCNMKVTEKYVIVCSLVIYSAPNWPTRAPFRAIYTVMNYRTVVGSHQPLVLSSVLCKQTWLPEKHSVHISGSPTLEIRLNKNAWSFPPFCLWWQEGVRHSPGRLLLWQNGCLYVCVWSYFYIWTWQHVSCKWKWWRQEKSF